MRKNFPYLLAINHPYLQGKDQIPQMLVMHFLKHLSRLIFLITFQKIFHTANSFFMKTQILMILIYPLLAQLFILNMFTFNLDSSNGYIGKSTIKKMYSIAILSVHL